MAITNIRRLLLSSPAKTIFHTLRFCAFTAECLSPPPASGPSQVGPLRLVGSEQDRIRLLCYHTECDTELSYSNLGVTVGKIRCYSMKEDLPVRPFSYSP